MPRPKPNKKKPVFSKLWIHCEGTESEVNYLEEYKVDKHSNKRLVSFIKIPKIPQNTPKSIVDKVVKEIRNSESHKDDIHWAVYDREHIAKYSNELHSKALKKAKDNNINVAITNVCFEFWIFLHFRFTTASFSNCDELVSSQEFRKQLKKVGIDNYDKGQVNLYEHVKHLLDDARQHAKKLVIHNQGIYPVGTPNYKMNPSTDFHLVLDAIDDFVKN